MHQQSIEFSPVSYGQSAQWFLYKIAPHIGGYNINYFWKINFRLNVSLFQKSLDFLTQRHLSIPTSYTDRNSELIQYIHKEIVTPFKFTNGERWSEDDFEKYIAKESIKPFNLEKETTQRWEVIKKSEEEFYFSLTAAHIGSDLWGHMIFMNELKKVYSALISDLPPELPVLDKQYSDFVFKQRCWIDSEEGENSFNFWKEKLGKNIPTLNLPFDHPRKTKNCFHGEFIGFSIENSLIEKLKKLAKKNRITPFILYLAAFQTFLYRYTGQKDFFIASPSAGRNHKDFPEVVGYFVNLFMVPSDTSEDISFLQLLKKLRQTIKEVRKHQDYPFSVLTKKLNLGRNMDQSSFPQVMFSWEAPNSFINRDQPLVTLNEEGKEVWDMGAFKLELLKKTMMDDVDLSLRVIEVQDQISLQFAYNPEIFERETIQRMCSNFKSLLKNICELSEVPLYQLPILSDQEFNTVVHQWNQTETAYPKEKTVHQVFEETVQQFPDSIAIVFDNIPMTYRELNRKANQVAHYLIKQGVETESPVIVCLERSHEMIIALLAILKAGGAYVPIDPAFPDDRFNYILEDTNSKIVLTKKQFLSRFSERDLNAVCLDQKQHLFEAESAENPNIPVTPDHLIYIYYTSGSTGRPKGVCVPHKGIVRLVKNTNYIKFGPSETMLMFVPLTFDFSAFEVWGSLLNGGKLEIFYPHIPAFEELADFMQKRKITTCLLTSGVFHQVVDKALDKLDTVRQMVTGGDVVSPAHVKRTLQRHRELCLIDGYGPTENSSITTFYAVTDPEKINRSVPIGKPISNTTVYILDKYHQPVPIGVVGEICTGGEGLAIGYLNRPEQNAEKFIQNPFSNDPESKLYKTGDLARFLPDGNIEFIGREDFQVKIRGFRIELGEIEVNLSRHPNVKDNLVVVRENQNTEKQLVAYYLSTNDREISPSEFRLFLKDKVPDYLIPNLFIKLESFPLTHNGKPDRNRLPDPKQVQKEAQTSFDVSASDYENYLTSVWKDVLNIGHIGVNDNFFDLGGSSISLLQVYSQLPPEIQDHITTIDLFEYPTIFSLAQYLEHKNVPVSSEIKKESTPQHSLNRDIAIIGLSGAFPGADSTDELWKNICNKVESISRFTETDLKKAGVPNAVYQDSDYVGAKGVLGNISGFDSDFFGFSPREADITDPQQRLFLEKSWEALENAGYNPNTFEGRIGVFGGSGYNTYQAGLTDSAITLNSTGDFPLIIGNEKDFLCTRVSYKMNLKGPAVAVQSACSTSLVAVHQACSALHKNECEMAIAGGVSIIGTNQGGYLYQKGGILSPDGRCRAFDKDANGTVPGQGVGTVVLKPLDQAVEDGNTIYAVIKGTAINNDGALKAGYTAPGIEGQTKVIQAAIDNAQVSPNTISYIETHGTGTKLGDPIEIRALQNVYGKQFDSGQRCALGAVKPNIGHLDAAAGITGLIKTALALKNRQLPPTINYTAPNPEAHLERSPFYVNTELQEWNAGNSPLRAAVSSFGIGGTNVHAILEEAPVTEPGTPTESTELVVLSAKTESALQRMLKNVSQYLSDSSESLSNIAYTLQVGRKEHQHRCMMLAKDKSDIARKIQTLDHASLKFGYSDQTRSVAFMFPGQGAQYIQMGKGLYTSKPVFKKALDECFDIYQKQNHVDLKPIIFPSDDHTEGVPSLQETIYTQPALFMMEYALAKLWLSWGVEPRLMIGHSIGEYAAACLAGVFSLEDALYLVSERGKLIQSLPAGRMLSVRLSEEEVASCLNDHISLAAINTPQRCVVSGESGSIDTLQHKLDEAGVDNTLLKTSHAFHSHMLEPVLESFRNVILKIKLNSPQRAYISTLTGSSVTAEEVTDPEYWVNHLRQPTRFSKGIKAILEHNNITLLEIGPGNVLSTLAKQNFEPEQFVTSVQSMRHFQLEMEDKDFILSSAGKLWLSGVNIDWELFSQHKEKRRIPLPTYPFERKTHWVDKRVKKVNPFDKKANTSDWFYLPTWKQSYHTHRFDEKIDLPADGNWLIFLDESGFGSELVDTLHSLNQKVFTVEKGDYFEEVAPGRFKIAVDSKEDYGLMIAAMKKDDSFPVNVIHLWTLDNNHVGYGDAFFDEKQTCGFYSLVLLTQALVRTQIKDKVKIQVVSENLMQVQGIDPLVPENSTILAFVNGVGQEHSNIYCQNIDLVVPFEGSPVRNSLISRLIKEISYPMPENHIAYRGDYRWVVSFEKNHRETSTTQNLTLREGGVYVITGGLGHLGLYTADYLTDIKGIKIALIGHSDFPAKKDWEKHLDSDDNHSVSDKINKILKLEQKGAEINVYTADVSDESAMESAFSQIEQDFGDISGIFHAAGQLGQSSFKKIAQLDLDMCEKQFTSKVYGSYVIGKILSKRTPDFVMLYSSISSITGGVDYTLYAAGNIFMDYFSQKQTKNFSFPWISVNWDGWKTSENQNLDFLIQREEGKSVFHKIFSQKLTSRVIVSTIDLFERLKKIQDKSLQFFDDNESMTVSLSGQKAYKARFVGPGNDIEKRVCDIWKEYLGVEKISVHDDFFEMGGDSLLAVRLIARLDKMYPNLFTEKSIIERPTIAGLSEIVSQQKSENQNNKKQEKKYQSLIELQKGGAEKSPLFLVHPGGGFVFYYRELVRYLPEDQPVYAFQSLGLDPGTTPLKSIEEMASLYMEEMLDVCPDGPYLLGGASLGGFVAYELAQQLKCRGKKVSLLTMIDTPGPGDQMPLRTDDDAEIVSLIFGDKVDLDLQQLKNKPLSEIVEAVVAQSQKDPGLSELTEEFVSSSIHVTKYNQQAMFNYQPKPYTGNILYFRHTEILCEYAKFPERPWMELAEDGLEFHKVPGNHYSMNFDPHVVHIANILREKLV